MIFWINLLQILPTHIYKEMGISSHSPPILYGLPNIILSIIPTMHCTSTPIFTFDLFTQLRPCCVVFDIHIICLLVCLNFVHFEHTHTQYTAPAAWYLIYARLLCALVHYYSLLPDLQEGHNNLLLGTNFVCSYFPDLPLLLSKRSQH